MSNLSQVKQIDLVAYAEGMGYERVASKCCPNSIYMKRDSEKIVIKRDADQHYVYCNVHDDRDQGSVIDFVMNRRSCGYAEAMTYLLGQNLPLPTGRFPNQPLQPVQDHKPDRAKVQRIWNVLERTQAPPYLLSRSIPLSVLMDARFADCWRQGRDGIAFPSWDRQGLCGLEFRGEGIKRFLSGGIKGLWASRNIKTCLRLVVCESAIDALSYHALHLDAADQEWPIGYVAFAGGLGSLQRELLAGLLRQCAERGCEILAGTDNDPAGDAYAEQLAELAGLAIDRHCPYGKDFNEDLCWCVREAGGDL